MMHYGRGYSIAKVEGLYELVDKLTNYSWTLCTGFEYEGLLFLNDAFSEDGAQEYVVLKDGVQIESLTVSWMKEKQLVGTIQQLLDGRLGANYGLAKPREHGDTCGLCA